MRRQDQHVDVSTQMKTSLSGKRSRVARACAAIAFISSLIPRAGSSCPYSVRDAGFVELTPVRYRLYCVLRNTTPDREKIRQMFEELSEIALLESNVEAELVNLDEQHTHEAAEYADFWDIATFPAAVLIAPDGRSLALPMVDARQPLKDTVWSVLERVVSSPKRQDLLRHVSRAWCTIVLVEGDDPAENRSATKKVADAIGLISGSVTAMGRVVHEPPHLLIVPQHAVEQEEVLLWSLGLDNYHHYGPRVAVLYGRGRQMGPVLQGDSLTRDSVLHLLYIVGMDCGCTTDPRLLVGKAIPLAWGSALQAALVTELGFDPESPMVKAEVSQIWSGSGAYVDGSTGYSEGVLGYTELPAEAAIFTTTQTVLEKADPPAATLGERASRTLLLVGGVLGVFVLIGGGVIMVVRTR